MPIVNPITPIRIMRATMRKLLFAAVALVAVACSQVPVYDYSIVVPNEEWHRDSLAVFDVDIADTAASYDVFVNLRNSTDYRYQNLYLFIDIQAPNGASQRDTLEFFLADNTGRWLGKGHGALRDNRYLYRKGVRFASKGIYRFNLQQAMRVDALKGVANVGVMVEEVEP